MKNRFSQFASTRAALCVLSSVAPLLLLAAFARNAFAQTAPQSSAATNATMPNAPAIREVPFRTLGSGVQSGCIRPAKMIIGDEKEWNRVWRIHDAKSVAPRVDFSRFRVIALLAGKGGSPLEIVQVASTREEITVFFHRGAATKAKEAPFHFALMEKTGTAARFIDQNGKVCAVCHITQ